MVFRQLPSSHNAHIVLYCVVYCVKGILYPECFDAVGWPTGRASGL